MKRNPEISSNKIMVFVLLQILYASIAFAYVEPISISDSLLLKIATAQDKQKKVAYLIDLSEYYINKDNQKGILYATEAKQVAKEYHLDKEEIFSCLLISRFHIDKGEFLEADNQIQWAIQRNKELQDSLIYAQSYYSQALLFIHLGEFNKAADLCYQALRIYDNRKDLPGQAKILNLIAAIHSTQMEFDKALEYSLRSLDIK
ncbi:MAG: tetratricopeptide repeat protein, partial [Bacteroidales bacterium]|nr:tetratricopeptide repeat protein [Bacteroidales bacterium]